MGQEEKSSCLKLHPKIQSIGYAKEKRKGRLYNMMYCYDSATMPIHDECEYWSESEVAEIAIYEVTPRIKKAMHRPDCTLFPISDIDQYSWEFANCKDEKEAFDVLMRSLNQNIYEWKMDI
jgi:hypothetical protein